MLANGTYSGAFTLTSKNGTASSGITIVAATRGAAVFASGSTITVKDCSYVQLEGLSFPYELSSGNTTQFRGTNHHCRITRCTFGPTSVGTSGTNKTPFIYLGDDADFIRIDHNELRNKANPGNSILGDGNFTTNQAVRHIRIDHNYIHDIRPEVTNEKEPIRLGVSTMSKTFSYSVVERNRFENCICEPEIVSIKACGVRVSGNSVATSIGGIVYRHGTDGIVTDNYIIDDRLGAPPTVPPATMIDQMGRLFTDSGGLTGEYHIFGAGLPGNGAGLVVYLHGDGDTAADTYEYAEPGTNYALSGNRGLIAVAKAKGYVLVVPKAPDTTGAVTWWENAARNITYLSDLLDYLVTAFQLDRSKIWLTGYSGGGEFITENFLPAKGAAKILGGGAVILGGGDAASTTPVGWTTAFKSAFPMNWITGLLDDGTFSGDNYNAIADAQAGRAYYAGQGFTTTLTTPPAWDHDIDGVFGPALDDYLPALPGYSPPSRTPGTARPTLITSYLVTGTAQNDLVTSSFTPAADEVIVVKCWAASQDAPVFGECTANGYGLTFASKAHIPTASGAVAYIFVAEVGATSPGSVAVTTSWHTANGAHGMVVERWSSGLARAVPAQSSPVTGSGAPSATITPTNANSVITWLNLDKTAASGTAAYRSSAVQTQSTTATVRAYAAYQNSTGTTGQTVGLSAPAGQNWALAAIELLPPPG